MKVRSNSQFQAVVRHGDRSRGQVVWKRASFCGWCGSKAGLGGRKKEERTAKEISQPPSIAATSVFIVLCEAVAVVVVQIRPQLLELLLLSHLDNISLMVAVVQHAKS